MTEDRLGRRGFLQILGASVASLAARDLLRNPETSQQHLDFNSDGVMLIDGQKFFPTVMYGLPGDPELKASWKKAWEAGANTITMFYPTEKALDYADELGLKTIIRLDYLFPHYASNLNEYQRILSRKSVIAFEVDEPNEYWAQQSLEGANKTKKEALFNLLQWLPDHQIPLRVTTDGRAQLMSNPESVKFLKELFALYPNIILGPDVYSDAVAEEVARYNLYWHQDADSYAHFRPIRTVWDVTGAHSEDEVYFGRTLTTKDMLYQAISGIAAGARGIGFYDNPWGTDSKGWPVDPRKNGVVNSYAKHLEDIKQINVLLFQALPGLLGQELARFKRKGVNVRVLQDGEVGDYYIFWSDDATKEAAIQVVTPENRKNFA